MANGDGRRNGHGSEEELAPPQTFTMPVLGMTYSSLVVVVIAALLNSHAGSGIEDEIDAPARTLVAVPVVLFAVVTFVACAVALLSPRSRRESMRVAEIFAWLIPAWLVMGAMVLGAIAFALHQAD